MVVAQHLLLFVGELLSLRRGRRLRLSGLRARTLGRVAVCLFQTPLKIALSFGQGTSLFGDAVHLAAGLFAAHAAEQAVGFVEPVRRAAGFFGAVRVRLSAAVALCTAHVVQGALKLLERPLQARIGLALTLTGGHLAHGSLALLGALRG